MKFVIALLFASTGCTATGVHLEARAVASKRPSNVAAYLTVSEDGAPVTDLSAEDFGVFEDGEPIEVARTRQVLLDRELAIAHHTVVLVDHSAATDESVRNELAAAVSIFVERVRRTQAVTVFAYDGAAELRHVGEFPRSSDSPRQEVSALKRLRPSDTSRNLNGAVLLAAKELDARLGQYRKPLTAGTLLVFAGGPDLARRVEESAVYEFSSRTPHTVIAVGIGEGALALRDIGKDGFFDAHTADTLSLAFEEAAHRVAGAHGGGYLFAYCSPARSGKRQLRIEVRLPAKAGDAPELQRRGSAYGEFDAEGFSAGCDPSTRPDFSRTKRGHAGGP